MALTENILVIKEFTEEEPIYSNDDIIIQNSTLKLVVEIEFRCSIKSVIQMIWRYEYTSVNGDIMEGARNVVQDFLNFKKEPQREYYNKGISTVHTGINHYRIELQGGLKEVFEQLFQEQNWKELILIDK